MRQGQAPRSCDLWASLRAVNMGKSVAAAPADAVTCWPLPTPGGGSADTPGVRTSGDPASMMLLMMLLSPRRPWLGLALAAALACAAVPSRAQPAAAQTTDVAGVAFDNKLSLGGAPLLLNGAGVRYKFVVKVYAAGLYVAPKVTTTEAFLANTGPRRIHIVMLRDIDANELGKLFTKGMEQNASRDEFMKAIPGTIRLGELFAEKKHLKAGESFSVDWIPGSGTLILVNGKPSGEPIKGPEFFSALMKIWLGKSPADALLKDALLGQSREARAN